MDYRVGELADLAGVSVRTLHHYDALGLVSPSERSHAGYRVYGPEDLSRLQQVLLYRQFGFSLTEIGRVLATSAGRREALQEQRVVLQERLDELNTSLELVDRTLAAMDEEGAEMSDKEMFEGLGEYERNEAEYGEEVRERWGGTDAYAESSRRAKEYSPQQWEEMKAEMEQIEATMARLLTEGVAATDERALAVAEEHRRLIDRWFYPCSHEMHVGLAEMYVADQRFTEHYDQRASGLARFVHDAIEANALAAWDR